MILDSSAILAVLRNERENEAFSAAIARARSRKISAANFLEAAIVMDGPRDPVASRKFDEFFQAANIVVEPVTAVQADLARLAYLRYGRGSGHPARLNFGDTFAYALAIDLGEPLLFKGSDFAQTDVRPAL